MLDKWGTAPTRIEVIEGWLTLKQLDGAVGVLVTPLDGSGKPLGEVRGRRLESGWEVATGDRPAVSYLVHIIHRALSSVWDISFPTDRGAPYLTTVFWSGDVGSKRTFSGKLSITRES
jgi:hypothetical protein